MKIGQHLSRIGKYKLLLDSTSSTQSYALELLRSGQYAHGALILARNQTDGKGRSERKWQSSEGQNFTGSIILVHKDKLRVEDSAFISMMASLAVYHTISHFATGQVDIKWPNDVLVNGKKVAGILISNQWRGNTMESSVLGIGINVNQTDFEALPKAGSLKLILGQEVALSKVTEQLLIQLDQWYDLLINHQRSLIQNSYQDSMYGYGQFIKVRLGEDPKIYGAKILGIEPNGKIKMEVEVLGHRIYDLDEIKIEY